MRVGALNFVEAECGCKNVNTKSFLIDLLLRFWRYPLKRPDLPPVLRMPFRRKRRVLRDDSSISVLDADTRRTFLDKRRKTRLASLVEATPGVHPAGAAPVSLSHAVILSTGQLVPLDTSEK